MLNVTRALISIAGPVRRDSTLTNKARLLVMYQPIIAGDVRYHIALIVNKMRANLQQLVLSALMIMF